MDLPLDVKRNCAEVVWNGHTVIRNAVPTGEFAALIDEFRSFVRATEYRHTLGKPGSE